jgi:hypothetical protein
MIQHRFPMEPICSSHIDADASYPAARSLRIVRSSAGHRAWAKIHKAMTFTKGTKNAIVHHLLSATRPRILDIGNGVEHKNYDEDDPLPQWLHIETLQCGAWPRSPCPRWMSVQADSYKLHDRYNQRHFIGCTRFSHPRGRTARSLANNIIAFPASSLLAAAAIVAAVSFGAKSVFLSESDEAV